MRKGTKSSIALFESVDIRTIKEWVGDYGAKWRKSNKDFYEGRHWQKGDGWIGPLVAGGADRMVQDLTFENVEKIFTSKGVVREIVDREVHSAVGIAPTVSFLGGEEQDEVVEDAKKLFQKWWDLRDAHKLLERGLAVSAWGSRSCFRLYIPRGVLNEKGEVPQMELEDALYYAHVEVIDPDFSGVYFDPETNDECRFVFWKVEYKDKPDEEHAEITYLDEQGETVIRHFVETGDGDKTLDEQARFSLNGELTIFQVDRPLLVTEQVVSLQKAINLNMTMLVTNLILAGFLERIILNASPPGHYEDDPNNPTLKTFVPDPFYVGAHTTNMLVGIETTDFEGNKRITTPEIKYREPIDTTTFGVAKDILYQSLLEEAHQIHVLINRDGNASAESRKQARSEFERAVLISANEAEDVVRWMASVILNMASLISNDKTFFGLRTTAQANVDSGPPTSEEEKATALLAEKEIISNEDAMRRVGVRDTNAMQERIERERRLGKGSLDAAMKRWSVFVQIVNTGIVPPEMAFEAVMSWEKDQLENFGTQRLASIQLEQEDVVPEVDR